jgi:serine palmitoyltransferase
MTGGQREAVNFSSYNYLGFAQSDGACADAVEASVKTHHIGSPATRSAGGTSEIVVKLEGLVARFVGKEDAMVISMGFATNSTTLPALVDRGCLILSDSLNHSSLVFGARLSGATIRVFQHNGASHCNHLISVVSDIHDLERMLREAIAYGQPRTWKKWKKILVVVEGLYSMEGSILKLPQIVELKKRYKFHLYVDEAHSIGALGPHGGGVCDYYGVDPNDVDILMGTFTKSFGGAGGYIAASKDIINHLRVYNHGSVHAESMPPLVAQQVYTAMRIILGEIGDGEGQRRIRAIAENSRYFRQGLKQQGFIVYGHDDSPVIPLLLFTPAKVP